MGRSALQEDDNSASLSSCVGEELNENLHEGTDWAHKCLTQQHTRSDEVCPFLIKR